MADDPLHRWSARRLATALAQQRIDVRRLVEALLERHQETAATLGAWAWLDGESARRQAHSMDTQPASGPWHGLPLAVKDNIDTAGVPTSYGSPVYAGHVPAADAACVALARANGAWVLGKTVSTEFANFTPAATCNPHDPAHTPGGSSSGSAAAVAAGLVPWALGTQTAGSVIRPAAFCGIVGYKPTARRIPRPGVKLNSDTMDEVGTLARDVADAAWLGLGLSGRDTVPEAMARAPRILVTDCARGDAATPEMAARLAAAAARLSAAGATVVDAAWTPELDALFEAQRVLQCYETARALAPEWLYRRAQLSPALASFIAEGQALPTPVYRAALAAVEAGRAALPGWMGDADIVLTFAAAGAAPRGLGSTGDPVFNRPWHVLGTPCLTLPAGRGAGGLPLGLQLVARPGEDDRLIAAARWVEGRFAAI